MPLFSGWDFLMRMKKMRDKIEKDIAVYIISSSLDPEDKDTSSRFPFVQDFISKPVERSEIERIFSNQYAGS
jgi:response regulator RpfG family c-di-GMP phosphodiesterase